MESAPRASPSSAAALPRGTPPRPAVMLGQNAATASVLPAPSPLNGPASSSTRLLRNIEQTSDLLRTFRQLKERGATREELAALHTRVRSLKAAQAREAGGDCFSAPAVSPSASALSSHHVDPVHGGAVRSSSRTGDASQPAPASSLQRRGEDRPYSRSSVHRPRSHHTDPFSTAHVSPPPGTAQDSSLSHPKARRTTQTPATRSAALSSTNAVAVVPSTSPHRSALRTTTPSELAAPLHSIVFAIVLAESHTRRELAHKWERRLLRYWADFKETRVAIALQPRLAPSVDASVPKSNGSKSAVIEGRQLALPERTVAKAQLAPRSATKADMSPILAARSLAEDQTASPVISAVPPEFTTASPAAVDHSSFCPAVPTVVATGSAAAAASAAFSPPPVPSIVAPPSRPSKDEDAAHQAFEVDEDALSRTAAAASAEEAARLRVEEERVAQEAANARAARVRAEKGAAAVEACTAAESDDRRVIENAESDQRGQAGQRAWESHNVAATAETVRVKAEREAANAAARQTIVRDETAMRGCLQHEEVDACVKLWQEAKEAREAVQEAEQLRRAVERRQRQIAEEERAAAAAALAQRTLETQKAEAQRAEELRRQQERTHHVRCLEHLAGALVKEWVGEAAVQTASRAAERERREKAAASEAARMEEEKRLAQELEQRNAAQAKALEEAAGARAAAGQAEADERLVLESDEGVARQRLREDAHIAHTSAAAAEASRVEAEETAARFKAVQEADDARRALEDQEAEVRRTAEAVESDARILLQGAAQRSHAAAAAAAAEASRLEAEAAEAALEAKAKQDAADARHAVEVEERENRQAVHDAEDDARRNVQEEMQRGRAAVAAAAVEAARAEAAEEKGTWATAQLEKRRQVEVLEDASRTLLDGWLRDAATAQVKRLTARRDAEDAEEERHIAEQEAEIAAAVQRERRLREELDEARRCESRQEAEADAAANYMQEAAQRDGEAAQRKYEQCSAVEHLAGTLLSQWIAESAEEMCARREAARAEEFVEAARRVREQQEEEVESLVNKEQTARQAIYADEAATRLELEACERREAEAARSAEANAQREHDEAQAHQGEETVATSSASTTASAPATPPNDTLMNKEETTTQPEEERSHADALSTDAATTVASSATTSPPKSAQRSLDPLSPQWQLPAPPLLLRLVDHLLDDVLHDAAQNVTQQDMAAAIGVQNATATGGEDNGGGASSATSVRSSPSITSLASTVSTPLSAPPRAQLPPPLSPRTVVAAASALQGEEELLRHEMGDGEEEGKALSVANTEPSLVISISPPPLSSTPQDANVPTVVDAAVGLRSDSTPGKSSAREALSPCVVPPPLPPPSALPSGPQPHMHLLQPDVLQAVTTMGTSFSSPVRSLSMTSFANEEEDELPSETAHGVRQPLNLTPPPNKDLCLLLTTADHGPQGLERREKAMEAEESSLFPESSRADSIETPHRATGEACATAEDNTLTTKPRNGSAAPAAAEVRERDQDALPMAPFELTTAAQRSAGAVATPPNAEWFSVTSLEAASSHMIQTLIRDAVRLLPSTTLVPSQPSPVKDSVGVNASLFGGERRHSPSLSPDRLERVRPLSPSHTHLLSDVREHVTPSGGSSNSSSCSGHSSEDGKRHAEGKHSISELGRGFTKADAQEGLPSSPSSSTSATPLVGAPAVAPGSAMTTGSNSSSGGGDARADLASLTTLVTAVATPNDFVEHLRQQEIAKKENAYQQNRYLTTRGLSLVAAKYLTSADAAAQVSELGPVEALTARAVGLVLAVGLVHNATVANRRARRQVERATRQRSAAVGTDEGSGGALGATQEEAHTTQLASAARDATTLAHKVGDADRHAVHTPSDNPEEPFPSGPEAAETGHSDSDEEMAPASPSLGRHGFGSGGGGPFGGGGGGIGGFPTSIAHTEEEDEEKAADPYSTRDGGVSQPSAHVPTSLPLSATSFTSLPSAEAAGAESRAATSTPPPPPAGSWPESPAPNIDAATTKAVNTNRNRLPIDWEAGLRGVAERVARDFMDYAARRVLMGQGEGQSNQDHLRTPESMLGEAMATVNIHALFTQELRPDDVARLTGYYLELALNGSRDRVDPHYAPAALGEHNIFGRRCSGDTDDGALLGSPPFSTTGKDGAASPPFMRGGSPINAAGSPSSMLSPSVFSPRLHPRSDTFLTTATAMHVRRGGLMQVVLEQCITNVMNDVIGDTVGWLGATVLQPLSTSDTRQ